MSEKKNQRDRILAALLNNERLTPLDALNRFGCFRLGARIFDLKADGYDVQKEMVTRNGKTYAEYFLNQK